MRVRNLQSLISNSQTAMSSDDLIQQQAKILFEQAYRHQRKGELGDAIELYKRSIAMFATAEAYTFLGWSYSMMRRYDDAIEMCHKAIELDPDYGNPYNDIGAYLLEQEKYAEAIPWLEKAIVAPRYEARQYPHTNLGRAYEKLGEHRRALRCYNEALRLDPLYLPAEWAKTALLGKLN